VTWPLLGHLLRASPELEQGFGNTNARPPCIFRRLQFSAPPVTVAHTQEDTARLTRAGITSIQIPATNTVVTSNNRFDTAELSGLRSAELNREVRAHTAVRLIILDSPRKSLDLSSAEPREASAGKIAGFGVTDGRGHLPRCHSRAPSCPSVKTVPRRSIRREKRGSKIRAFAPRAS
jgi:hypothetical protein